MLMTRNANQPTRHALQNVETEAALLGAMLMEPRLIDQAADRLQIEDFYEPAHGRIFDAIVREHAVGGRPTPIILRPLFENDPALAELGGAGYLAQLTGSGAGMIGFRHFIKQIEDLAARRRLLDTLTDVRDATENLDFTLPEIVDRADAALVASVERREVTTQPTLGEAIDEAIARIEEIRANEGRVGATTGILELDDLLGGFEPGQVIVVAGRPGMGKTAVACSASLGLARRGHGVLYVSLEMKSAELGMRMVSDLCCRSRGNWISFRSIVDGSVKDAELETMRQARTAIGSWPMRIVDASAMTISRLTLAVRRAKRQFEAKGNKLEVVVIDYLQLLRSDDRRASAYETVSEISMGLKALAKELGVAVIALAQLNRSVEQREDKRPLLSDLRDSGQIEQDADAVMFLYREEYYLQRTRPKKGMEDHHEQARHEAAGVLTLICAKRRNGAIGDANCMYLAPYQAVRSSDWRSS